MHAHPLRFFFKILFAVSFVFVLACSSLHKNAEILMAGEEYGEAVKVYEQILTADQSDAKAIVGLKKARLGWIDKRLIDVRMLRLSEQAGPAAELLKKVIESERTWKFFPEGAVQYTQEEETRFAERFVTSQVDAWKGKGYILQARALLQNYRPIFATASRVKQYEGIGSQLSEVATKQCEAYRPQLSPAQPYFAAFAKRYCESWGISIDPGFDVLKARAFGLFNSLQIDASVEGIPEALQAYGKDLLMREFQETAWFDLQGAEKLPVTIKAGFAMDHAKTVEKTVHSYTVQVPYTVMIPQIRTIPHTTYYKSCTQYGCITTPQTTYTYETYMVPITKYRDDPRQFPYERWRHHQVLVFHAELRSIIKGTEAQGVHTQRADDTDTEHPHTVAEIGLYPDRLDLPDPLVWLKHQMGEAVHRWGSALSAGWLRVHCSALDAATTGSALADHVFRCLREPQPRPPAFVETWFREHFDADHDDVEKWLMRKDHLPKTAPIREAERIILMTPQEPSLSNQAVDSEKAIQATPFQAEASEPPHFLETEKGISETPADADKAQSEPVQVPEQGDRIRDCIEREEAKQFRAPDYLSRCLSM